VIAAPNQAPGPWFFVSGPEAEATTHQLFTHSVDIAVVGAGVAGCYVAHRLSSPRLRSSLQPDSPLWGLLGERESLRVALLEASERIGGRLWSIHGASGWPPIQELGGMRFLATDVLLNDLLDHLDLSHLIVPFPSDETANLVHIRGQTSRRNELIQLAAATYSLRSEETGKGVKELVQLACNLAFPEFGSLRDAYHAAIGRRAWQEAQQISAEFQRRKRGWRLKGQPLFHCSWGDLLRAVLSEEAVNFLQDADGYEILRSNGNAASWLDTIFFVADDAQDMCLSSGFQTLPDTLWQRFKLDGGFTFLRHQLVRLDPADSSTGSAYDLLFNRTLPNGKPTDQLCLRARIVILAMPRPALERLEQDTQLCRHPLFQQDLRAVASIVAFRLFLTYSSAWWEELGIVEGRSTTDLHCRQVYYLQSHPAMTSIRHAHQETGSCTTAMLMAVYTNGPDVEFWRSLKGEPTNWPQEAALNLHPATLSMIQQAQLMLATMHGIDNLPEPLEAYYQDWSDPPHGAGWHVWNPGAVDAEVIPRMRKPLEQHDVYVVGECWSHQPGSVVGALSSSECMLLDHLRLRWPEWLRHEGTSLGPR
jgi:monoamine oxidase